ncbi:DUF1648 domain-containing protein [Streptomyces sp. NPDC050560]|uniref:DUF1648 domain-containing protein n=1 Tax=Streptomyces sp. NPDC050560 TaxID=3365630 RepID=UPI0037884A86
MSAIRRGALTAVPFGAAAAVYISVFLANYGRLPGRVATHFSGGGAPDGSMGKAAALWLGGGLIVGLGVLFSVLSVASRDGRGVRLTAAVGAGTAILVGYPLVFTVVLNLDARGPGEVRLPLWHAGVLLVAGLAVGGATWWLGQSGPGPTRPAAPSLTLSKGEAATWSRTAASRTVMATAAAVVLGGALATALDSWRTGVLPLLLGLVCLAFAAIRVTVDRRGVTVASTVLPRPRLVVPLAGIRDASSVRIGAMTDFGGWGYRIRPNRRGVVLRSGEALSVRTVRGREYVVTVDDSATAASLVNGLVERGTERRG